MSKIAITDYYPFPEEEKEVLGDLVGTEVGEDTEVLIVWHTYVNEEYVSKLPKLRGVQRYGVGYDTLDVPFLKSKGIVACNNPDYGTDEVADTAVAMIMNIARGVSKYNHDAKKLFDSWQENIIPSIKRNSDTVVGFIGAGRIGGNALMKCNALKFKTVFYDPYKERGYEKMINAKRVESLEELLSLSDIVSIHTPLTAETRGIINAEFIKQMKSGASLVNTARGGLFADVDLLLDALKSNKIANLAIDVVEQEPPTSYKLVDAWRASEDDLEGRLIINPHTSYYSQASSRELRLNAAKNALRMFNGEKPYNIL
jgi:phosphoglycerate dehydrogenase-like enzyme